MLEATHVNEANSLRWFRVLQDFHIIKERGGHQGMGCSFDIAEGIVYLDIPHSLGV